MHRFFIALAALVLVAACEESDALDKAPKPIGEFNLDHNVVVAPNLVMGPVSREAPNDQWIEAVTKAVDKRFSRYDGNQRYHFGISLEGYVLAQPGIPLVLSPKSILILKLTVWDDAASKKLNEEPEQITVLESLDGETVVGSGFTRTPEEQMEALAFNAAKMIQRYLEKQHLKNRWFARTDETQARLDAAAQNEDITAEDAPEETAEESEENAATDTPDDADDEAATDALEGAEAVAG